MSACFISYHSCGYVFYTALCSKTRWMHTKCAVVCQCLLDVAYNQILNFQYHNMEWVEIIGVWQQVARGNIQQISSNSPNRAALPCAALSAYCNYMNKC